MNPQGGLHTAGEAAERKAELEEALHASGVPLATPASQQQGPAAVTGSKGKRSRASDDLRCLQISITNLARSYLATSALRPLYPNAIWDSLQLCWPTQAEHLVHPIGTA